MSRRDDERTQRFEQLAGENRARLWGIARAYAGPHAEDLLQEILLQIWRSLPRLREPQYARTWCYRIALNTAIAWQRRQQRDRTVTVDDHVLAASVSPAADNAARHLQRFLASLGEVDRALMLLMLDDVDSAAIAQILGLSDGAVRVRIHRLKQKLADWEPLDS